METLDLKGAAAVLHCHPETLKKWARLELVPATKVGRACRKYRKGITIRSFPVRSLQINGLLVTPLTLSKCWEVLRRRRKY